MTTRKKPAPEPTIHGKLVASMTSALGAGIDWPSLRRSYASITPPGATRDDVERALAEVARIHGYTPSTPIVPTAMAALLQAAEEAARLLTALANSEDLSTANSIASEVQAEALRRAVAAAKEG